MLHANASKSKKISTVANPLRMTTSLYHIDTSEMVPLFSHSKLNRYNDIRLNEMSMFYDAIKKSNLRLNEIARAT